VSNGRPDILDNLPEGRSHADGLAYLAADIPGEHGVSVATGYVNLGGLHQLATLIDEGRGFRLLIGALPEQGLGEAPPLLSFEQRMRVLAGERDLSRFPPSRAAERLQAIDAWLARPEVEVKRFLARFLHGKAYLFGSIDDPRAALVTSANLTNAGLLHNLELGLVDYNVAPSRAALEWFQTLWDDAAPFEDELRELLFPMIDMVDAETVYLRALLELYGEELSTDGGSPVTRVSLTSFGRDGYERARRILARHQGVVYADGVGTGKTEIGLAFIEEYGLEQGRQALVVCPAQLRDMWETRIARARLPGEVLSFNELASDEQLAPGASNPRRHLKADKDAYRLVVVDEAHAFRSDDTTWYRAMERLLGGERKDVVLLTATPVNNGLWDLYNLVLLFAHHDRAFSSIGIPSVRRLFVRAGANERDPENLDPDVLFPVADAVSVRRDRRFIQEHYPNESFADGTPVRFPNPVAETRRYDLDAAHPGLFVAIVSEIRELEMARYRPSAWLLEGDESDAERRLSGLLQSQILKRFESSWAACLATVERMIVAHDAFLAGWDDGHGTVPSRETLRRAAHDEAAEAGIATWLEDVLVDDAGARPASDFDPEYGNVVAADRDRLVRIRDRLSTMSADEDPKLQLLKEILEASPAQKVAVFATYGETIEYLDEYLPEETSGRRRVTVIGGESTPEERMHALARFAPVSVIGPDHVPADGEVDLLLSTDVLSEGQNLQQAQAVVSYDMPWNPQRVVQRNGRVIRLRSPHDEVFLTTMLPEPGELEELLRLETLVRGKIRAAELYGMEVEVIDDISTELRSYAERLADGDLTLLDDDTDDGVSGAFLGEELRARIMRAQLEGRFASLAALPWGIGAAIRRSAVSQSEGPAGVFFATRTRPMKGAEDGYRYWRYVEFAAEEPLGSDLECLRRINPEGSQETELGDVDLEAAWNTAAASIVEEHNRRADPRAAQEAIGPAQRFALELLRDPTVILPEGAERASEALAVERSSAVRRELNGIQAELREERITPSAAAQQIVNLVERLGLQPVPLDDVPEEISTDDLGVVCWMAVL
jgi:superfamily II DNA or RNA helicase